MRKQLNTTGPVKADGLDVESLSINDDVVYDEMVAQMNEKAVEVRHEFVEEIYHA